MDTEHHERSLRFAKIVIISAAAVFAVLAIAFTWLITADHGQQSSTNQACTNEAKICPDGSSVGRSGINCEFGACPDQPSNRSE